MNSHIEFLNTSIKKTQKTEHEKRQAELDKQQNKYSQLMSTQKTKIVSSLTSKPVHPYLNLHSLKEFTKMTKDATNAQLAMKNMEADGKQSSMGSPSTTRTKPNFFRQLNKELELRMEEMTSSN